MDKAYKSGRFFFAAAIVAFGVQQLIYGDFVPGPLIAPAWLPWRVFWAYLSGVVLIAGGVGILIDKTARRAAILLGTLLFLIVLFFHLPAPGPILHDGIARTRAFEALTLVGCSLLLAGGSLAKLGRYVFAVPMAVFGIQHFMYAVFVAAVVPAWIPAPVAWAYITGGAFIAASVAIIFNVKARLAAALLGLMFFLWAVLLHAPRLVTRLHDGNEWNSALVAVALCGGAWILAEILPKDA